MTPLIQSHPVYNATVTAEGFGKVVLLVLVCLGMIVCECRFNYHVRDLIDTLLIHIDVLLQRKQQWALMLIHSVATDASGFRIVFGVCVQRLWCCCCVAEFHPFAMNKDFLVESWAKNSFVK